MTCCNMCFPIIFVGRWNLTEKQSSLTVWFSNREFYEKKFYLLQCNFTSLSAIHFRVWNLYQITKSPTCMKCIILGNYERMLMVNRHRSAWRWICLSRKDSRHFDCMLMLIATDPFVRWHNGWNEDCLSCEGMLVLQKWFWMYWQRKRSHLVLLVEVQLLMMIDDKCFV